MRRAHRLRLLPLLFATVLASPLAAQDARDLLGRLLSTLVSPLEVTVGAQGDRDVALRVTHRAVAGFSGLRLTARALDRDLREVRGFRTDPVSLAGPDGEVELRVVYEGAERVRTAALDVALVRADGSAVATRTVLLPRPWPLAAGSAGDPATSGPEGALGDTAPVSSPPESGGSVRLDPLPLGDTPTGGAAPGPVTGMPSDPTPPPAAPPSYAYAWANDPVAAEYAAHPRYAFNPGGEVRIRRAGVGRYAVLFDGYRPPGGGNVQVTAYGAGDARCGVERWIARGASLDVGVSCHGADGAPSDSAFSVLAFGSAGGDREGYAWAEQPAATRYAPSPLYSAATGGGAVRVERRAAGSYSVHFGALAPAAGATPHAQVTAYGPGPGHCGLGPLAGAGADLVADVRCFDASQAPADRRFSILALPLARAASRVATATFDLRRARGFNSAGGTIAVDRLGPGSFALRLGGLGGPGPGGTVQVSAAGGHAGSCKVERWSAFGADFEARIACRSAAGAPADTPFSALVLR